MLCLRRRKLRSMVSPRCRTVGVLSIDGLRDLRFVRPNLGAKNHLIAGLAVP